MLSLQKESFRGDVGHVWGAASKQALAGLCGLNKHRHEERKVEGWRTFLERRSILWGIEVFFLKVQSLGWHELAAQNEDTGHDILQHFIKKSFLC